METMNAKAKVVSLSSTTTSGGNQETKRRSFFMAQIMLRVLAFAFSICSISIMVTSTQTIMIFGINFTARYDDSSAFRFLFGASITVSILSIMSLIFVCLLMRGPQSLSQPMKYFYIFLHDMVVMVLMMSACASASAVGFVSRYGEPKMGWSAVCNNVSKFCNQVLISVILSYLSFFSYLALTTLSAHKLMSPPRVDQD